MQLDGMLNLKLILDLIIEVDDNSLRLITQHLQTLRMKDVPGDTVRTIFSYMKGVLLLLGNCGKMLTDVMGLLSNTFCSAGVRIF